MHEGVVDSNYENRKEREEKKLADGHVCKVIPVLASYIADFPEQSEVTCTMESSCMTCKVPHNKRGELYTDADLAASGMMRHLRSTHIALLEEHLNPNCSAQFKLGFLKHVYPPFWSSLKRTNVHEWFAPDLLHQIHKGVFKAHLFNWIVNIVGQKEIDA